MTDLFASRRFLKFSFPLIFYSFIFRSKRFLVLLFHSTLALLSANFFSFSWLFLALQRCGRGVEHSNEIVVQYLFFIIHFPVFCCLLRQLLLLSSLACPFCCPYKFHIIYADRRYVQPAARSQPAELFSTSWNGKGGMMI